jgi:hypothetical protein
MALSYSCINCYLCVPAVFLPAAVAFSKSQAQADGTRLHMLRTKPVKLRWRVRFI